MAQRLEKIAREQQTLTESLSYWVGQPLQASQQIPSDRAEHTLNHSRQLVYAGKTQQAIDRLTGLRGEVRNGETFIFAAQQTQLQQLLAISYLRLGEQKNCLADHSAASCLFPVRGQGIHEAKEPSRKAITLYTQMLHRRPDDLQARWLLNLAYMTVGEYPQQVPKQWLLPPERLGWADQKGSFQNIAPRVGLADVGLSGGSLLEDFNNDGHLDVMASSWGLTDQLQYYTNNGDGTFTKQTSQAGLRGIVGGLNLVQGDYNNDGHVDVFVLRGAWLGRSGKHPNSLLQNNGDGTFTDVTQTAGLLSFHPTQTAAWGDFNNDGWLDLFIGNETSGGHEHPCELYRNNGDGTFTNIANEVGLDVKGFVKGAVWGDYTNDGYLDLYISRLGSPNLLFRSDAVDTSFGRQFTEVGRLAGVEEPRHSFPTWFWDYNNDGWLDIFVSGYGPGYTANPAQVAAEYLGRSAAAATPRLYRNNGDGTFEEVTEAVGLNKVIYGMGANYGDLNNDGYLDLYIGTGGPRFSSVIPNRMFQSTQADSFQEVTAATGTGHLQKGHGVSFGDSDHDGDQDLFTVIGGAFPGDVYPNALFENPGHNNHWITLQLQGKQSNRSAIGARIQLDLNTSTGQRKIYAVVSSGGSFGASSLQQEIGLGQAKAIDRLKISWPVSGSVQVFHNVTMDRFYTVTEDSSYLKPFSL